MSLERSRRSFAGWTASPWLSSWPRHGFVSFPLRTLPAASMIICDCCVAVTGQERQLFARLSVFSGGFDLEAAATVCAEGGIVSGQVLDEIQDLVDKSLLAVERRAGATRFRMLDFVRQYASERLAAAGEDVPLAVRHLPISGNWPSARTGS